MNIYISSSWKNRDAVNSLAIYLRSIGHEVYDFTDRRCRQTPTIPPEKYPEQFDPKIHEYRSYINKPEWRDAVLENKGALERADVVVLLLPCGVDAHADWAYAIGRGARSVVAGHPNPGERHPVHLWADKIVECTLDAAAWIESLAKQIQ